MHKDEHTGDFKAPYQRQPLFYFRPMKSASPVLPGGLVIFVRVFRAAFRVDFRL